MRRLRADRGDNPDPGSFMTSARLGNEPNLLDSIIRTPGAGPVEFIEVNGTHARWLEHSHCDAVRAPPDQAR
jgi:hypothetical protein